MKKHELASYLSMNTSLTLDETYNVLAMLGDTIEACFRAGESVDVPGLGEFALTYDCEIEFNPDEHIAVAAKEQ